MFSVVLGTGDTDGDQNRPNVCSERGGWGWGRSDTTQDKRVGYRHTVSGRTVRSAKEENEPGEGVRWELGWLECEKVTVPAPGGHHLMGF